jgi:pilus assembly protein CpaE
MTTSGKIRVLVVDDVPETRENIRRLLQFENDIEVVGVAGTGRQAVDTCKELKPDVVLMDINMPDMDGITATEHIRRHSPATQIVILSVQGDPNYMRRAMLAGARDFLTKPPAGDDLTAALRRAGKMAFEERAKAAAPDQAGAGRATLLPGMGNVNGKIIVVYSPKGGAGTTTLAVNLAVALNNEQSRVALVDGNMQFGDVAVFMNESVKNSILELAPRADELDPDIIQEVLINHAATGVKILAAPPRPEYAENVTGEQFQKVVTFLTRIFSYVIVDTSTTLTDVVLAAMDICHAVVLITTQDIPSLKSARQYLDLADILHVERRRILFLMNKFDKRIGILPEKIGESFKQEIVGVIPFEDKVIIPSVNRGIPFMTGDRSRPIAKAFLALADLIRQKVSEEQDADVPATPAKR